jgi:hypothetical protein
MHRCYWTQGLGDEAAAVFDWLRYLCRPGTGGGLEAAVLSIAQRQDQGGVGRQEARAAGVCGCPVLEGTLHSGSCDLRDPGMLWSMEAEEVVTTL